MTLAFLDPAYAWLPGTVFGVLTGLWGAAFGIASGLRKGGSSLLSTLRIIYWLLLAAAFVMLQLGVVAFSKQQQPQAAWLGWLLPGFIGCLVLGALYVVVKGSGKDSSGSSPLSSSEAKAYAPPPPSIREREASSSEENRGSQSPE